MNKIPYIKTTTETFDAIVVGSGITGGWAAKELCEKGLKTLMVERGRPVEHQKDYTGEGVTRWQLDNRGEMSDEETKDQHIQKFCYAFKKTTKMFFGNDTQYPYQTKKDTGFNWIRGNQLGGKSLLWHRASYRMSDLDFNANALDGHGVDWPIRYKDIESWYAYVEKFVGISGSYENLDVLPDSVFLPPFEMNAVERELKKRIEKQYPQRRLIPGRAAHLTEPQEHHKALGRYKCMARNECQKGCSFGAYFSTQSATLPAALKTNNLSVATDSVVHSVIYDEKTNRATGVRIIDNNTLETREYFAKIIFLCASTLGSTQVMLNSKSESFPTGIANSSGVLGHYLMDHTYNASAMGIVPGFDDQYYYGRRPANVYMPRFVNVKGKDRDYLRGFAYQGEALRFDWRSNRNNVEGFGAQLKKSYQTPGNWFFTLQGSGEMLPDFNNKVTLHKTKTDKWGIPQLVIDCKFSENDHKMMQDMADTAAELLENIGCIDVTKRITQAPPGSAIHEVGTARMGRDPKTSVLNGYNQTHDIPNLFVTDGASWASCGWQNPSLTFMALTVRAVDYAVKLLKDKKI